MADIRLSGRAAIRGFVPYFRFYFTPSIYREIWKVPFGAGATPEQVTVAGPSLFQDTDPVASPNYQQIAFLRRISLGNARLYVCDADGSNVTELINADCNIPSWHPDGSKILTRAGSQVLTIEPDGSNQTTVENLANLVRPAYNYDGTKIAYQIDNTNPTVDELWVMDEDGTNNTQLDANTGLGGAPVYAWAKTQDVIAYVITTGSISTAGVYVINADGTGKTSVSTSTVGLTRYSWAPDDSVVYGGITVSGNRRIYAIQPDGSGEAALSPTLDTSSNADQGLARVMGNSRIWTVSANPNFDLISAALDGSDQTIHDDTNNEATYGAVFTREVA